MNENTPTSSGLKVFKFSVKLTLGTEMVTTNGEHSQRHVKKPFISPTGSERYFPVRECYKSHSERNN